ncbi:hypothetical protein M9Y10_039193 [Tritrichomonas musculus]|uniref:Lecithin:cholesterol acyltransferase family protein n=1 Tax=Tritrichomonas musculus TaxID=1915356 RepID=A0ABR2KAJ6_9EUKA
MLFTFLFTLFIKSEILNPVILVPGLYGSNLYVTYGPEIEVPWYCPKQMDDELLWIGSKFIIPPLMNCACIVSTTKFDNETNQVHNQPGVSINVHDFGGIGSVDYIIKMQSKYHQNENSTSDKNFKDTFKNKISNLHFFDNFHTFIEFFESKGYTVGQNFFVAPYDWRMGPLYTDDFWPLLRELIENAYKKSHGKKITLIGFSMGTFMIQQFLAADKLIKKARYERIFNPYTRILTSVKDPKVVVSEKWKRKYIEKVIFLAPSFGGSLAIYDAIQMRYSPLTPSFRNEYISDVVTSLPSIHSHLLNHVIFNNVSVARGPDGENYTAKNFRDLISNYSHIREEFVPILDITQGLQKNAPIDIGEKIPLMVIYNSKVPTMSFLDFNRGWEKDPVRYYEEVGDGTIPARGPRYICNHWDSSHRPLVCIDLQNRDSKHYKHSALVSNLDVLKLIYNATVNLNLNSEIWWKKNGPINIELNEK